MSPLSDNFVIRDMMRKVKRYHARAIMDWRVGIDMHTRGDGEFIERRLKDETTHRIAHEVGRDMMNDAGAFELTRSIEEVVMRAQLIAMTEDQLYRLMCDAYNAGMRKRPSIVMMPPP